MPDGVLSIADEILTARIRYIIAALIGPVGIFLSSLVSASTHWQFYLAPGFCFLVVAACVTRGRTSRFFGSCIGLAVFAFTCLYAVSEAKTGRWLPAHRRDASLFGAIISVIVFGLPGLYWAWKARFGFKPQDKGSSA